MNQGVIEALKLLWNMLPSKGKIVVGVAGIGAACLVGHGAFTTFSNCFRRTVQTVETVSDRAFATADNAVGKASSCADHAVDKTSEILKHAIDAHYEVETPVFKLRPTTKNPRGFISVTETTEMTFQ